MPTKAQRREATRREAEKRQTTLATRDQRRSIVTSGMSALVAHNQRNGSGRRNQGGHHSHYQQR